MTNPNRPEDLSEQQLRRLLLDKRHDSRQRRLERFRRTGRAVRLAPDLPPAAFDEWRTQPPAEGLDVGFGGSGSTSSKRRWFDRLLLGVEVLAVIGLAASDRSKTVKTILKSVLLVGVFGSEIRTDKSAA